MPDDFNKNTSIEDEIEKSLQKMVEEETTVAKAYVGKADDYKAQIEEERAKILILQKEKERIDLQISQIQAEIDRLEGTVDRLSMN